ncbi:hypothetical protein [Pseudomonas fluorescens]|jgi:hypothetical protein|uniref:hypothetical protein n=1 Tax=Pseudomonas fluorescens TaxID=294 RepID=UPI0019127E28|nr:hypothetical protein [Pseudomonas fluorescens]
MGRNWIFPGIALLAGFALADLPAEPCALVINGSHVTDPRTWLEVGDLRICTNAGQDEEVPDSADVVVWEAGDAKWASTAPVHQAGSVLVARQSSSRWQVIRTLRSPHPVAYSGFGAQLASDGKWLAVLEGRQQRVWVFDLNNLAAQAEEIEAARGFAKAIAVADNQIIIGGTGEARFYTKQSVWTLSTRVAGPPGTVDVFTGQIVAQGNLLVSTTSGINTGDGLVFPGRVDVYRHSPTGWQWESRLSPKGDGEPFGQSCCVSLNHGQVTVTLGDQRWHFNREGADWIAAPGVEQ